MKKERERNMKTEKEEERRSESKANSLEIIKERERKNNPLYSQMSFKMSQKGST
jgi:hypothetical protein